MSNTTTITYNGLASARIDMRWITHAISHSLKADKANKLTLPIGKNKVEIGELFNISGNFSNEDIVIENSTTKLDYIGHQLPEKFSLNIDGDCGHYAGAELAGGKLIINGSSSDYTACAMNKGMVEVKQNTGGYSGSAYAGHKRGMTGGTLLVHGNSGDFTGDLMRRGIIMVSGNIGDYCGSRMIAGTITNLGTVGKQVGVGMRRGTLLFPELPQEMSTSFSNCGRHNLGYLTLLLHELRRHDSQFKSLHSMRRRVQKYMGDLSVGGLGEILIWIG